MSKSHENTSETAVTILSKVQNLRRAHLPWGEQSDIRLSGAETGGAFGVLDYQASAGFIVPRHVHHREDEILRVVRGRAVFWTPQLSGSMEVGDIVKLPKDVEHAWRQYGDEPIGFVVNVAPAGFETFSQRPRRRTLRKMISQDVPASRFNTGSRSLDPA